MLKFKVGKNRVNEPKKAQSLPKPGRFNKLFGTGGRQRHGNRCRQYRLSITSPAYPRTGPGPGLFIAIRRPVSSSKVFSWRLCTGYAPFFIEQQGCRGALQGPATAALLQDVGNNSSIDADPVLSQPAPRKTVSL